MGGLIIVVLWPMVLPVMLLVFLDVAMPLIAPILLVWNLLVLAGLWFVRRLWKRSGAYSWNYIRRQPGWKQLVIRFLQGALVLMIAWEIFLVLVSGAYVIWRPEFLELF